MFFFTYLARELRRRLRQAIFIALGLAVGVGLVLTVTAASKGVQNAQAAVLKGLYGVGTDITVTKPPPAFNPNAAGNGGTRVSIGPGGAQVCNNGKCHIRRPVHRQPQQRRRRCAERGDRRADRAAASTSPRRPADCR